MRAWLVFAALQTANVMIHAALGDAVLLKQGTRAYSIWLIVSVGLVFVIGLAKSPIGRKVLGLPKEEEEITDEKRKSASGGFVTAPMLLGLSAIMLVIAIFLSGCGGYNTARRTVALFDAGNGVAARVSRAWTNKCNTQANALRGERKFKEAEDVYAKCDKYGVLLLKIITVSVDATLTAADSIEMSERLGNKEYLSAVAALYPVGCDVVQTFKDAGVSGLPSEILALCPTPRVSGEGAHNG